MIVQKAAGSYLKVVLWIEIVPCWCDALMFIAGSIWFHWLHFRTNRTCCTALYINRGVYKIRTILSSIYVDEFWKMIIAKISWARSSWKALDPNTIPAFQHGKSRPKFQNGVFIQHDSRLIPLWERWGAPLSNRYNESMSFIVIFSHCLFLRLLITIRLSYEILYQ